MPIKPYNYLTAYFGLSCMSLLQSTQPKNKHHHYPHALLPVEQIVQITAHRTGASNWILLAVRVFCAYPVFVCCAPCSGSAKGSSPSWYKGEELQWSERRVEHTGWQWGGFFICMRIGSFSGKWVSTSYSGQLQAFDTSGRCKMHSNAVWSNYSHQDSYRLGI